MACVLTVTANPLLNFVTDAAVSPGAVNRVRGCAVSTEGKGVNVARVLAAHGHRCIACGFAGGHTGALLAETVAVHGVETAFTPTAARLRVGFQASPPDADHPTILLENGFRVTAAECAALTDAVADRLALADLVIVAGSVPDPAADALYVAILERCAAAGVPCWVDAYGPAMHAALHATPGPALSKPNRQEYADSDAWERVGELHLTDGARGIEVRSGDARFRVHPAPVRQVNPVGSGDCYLAALAHARLSGHPLREQLRYAAAAGAANATRGDVAMIAPDEIAPLVDAVVVEPLPGGGETR